MGFSRTAYFLFLTAVLLTGLGRIAILPPFEGADETGHYSRIKATAFHSPDQHLSAEAVYYTRKGPMAPGWIVNAQRHKNDPLVKKPADAYRVFMDYRAFFSAPAKKIAAYKAAFRDTPAPRKFTSSSQDNWEKQHPGLYYIVFGAVYRALPPLPLMHELLVLRVINFIVAFAGLVVGLEATARHLAATGYKNARFLCALGAAFPFLMPSFFMDLARLGNDDMALFLFGVLWALFLPLLREPGGAAEWLLAGIVMGGCWLIKATMAPPCLGMLLFLFAARLRGGARFSAATGQLLLILLAAAAVGWQGYGAILSAGRYPGDGDIAALHLAPAQWRPLFEQVAFTLTSAVYFFSDWTAYPVPPLKLALRLVPAALAALGYAVVLVRKKSLLAREALPVWTVAPLMGALVAYSIVIFLSPKGNYPIPAYYISTLAPALALAFGLGLGGERKGVLAAILSLSLLSTADYIWKEMNLYAGCRFFIDSTPKGLAAARALEKDMHPCYAAMHARLAVLGWPEAGVVLLAAGVVSALAGIFLLLREEKA